MTLKDKAAFADGQRATIDQSLAIIYALLALAVIIAVLGIVNTLGLSVIERTREVGLLRAVGMSRRQLRSMIRLESVAISILGAVLGIGLGLIFGISLRRPWPVKASPVLSIPWTQLVVFVILAGLVGVLAAVFPARRAARMGVLGRSPPSEWRTQNGRDPHSDNGCDRRRGERVTEEPARRGDGAAAVTGVAAGATALLGLVGSAHPVPFATVRAGGSTFSGRHLRYDSLFSGAGNRGTDMVTLLSRLPLLVTSVLGCRRGPAALATGPDRRPDLLPVCLGEYGGRCCAQPGIPAVRDRVRREPVVFRAVRRQC